MIRIGERFGKLVVLGEAERGGLTKRRWFCRCDCGNEKSITGDKLRSGNTSSCGCFQRVFRNAGMSRRTHGHGGKRASLTYKKWCGMIRRCTNKNEQNYSRYGGAGIRVAERWRLFENFLADMGECPHGMTLDRIDSSGHYEPGNCRWADTHTQNVNRKRLVWLEWNGERLWLSEWSRRLGFPEPAIARRLRLGWSTERALTTPLREWPRRETSRA